MERSAKVIQLRMGQSVGNFTLTKGQWQEYIDEIQTAAPIVAEFLEKLNFEGRGREDREAYLASMAAAISAMAYVSEFAADKVAFMPIPESGVVQ